MNDELYVTDELGNPIGTTDKESAAKFLPLPADAFEGFKKLSVDDQIDKLLTDPTIVAMVENAVQGAVQDALDNQEADEPYTHANYLTPVAELRAEFEEFRDRVAAAFKHAGFKF